MRPSVHAKKSPSEARCLPQLGVVLLEQGRPQQALAYLDKALEMDPDHQQALLNSAVLIQVSFKYYI